MNHHRALGIQLTFDSNSDWRRCAAISWEEFPWTATDWARLRVLMGAWGEFTVSIIVGELTCDRIIIFSFQTFIFFFQLSRTPKFHFISTHCAAPKLIFGDRTREAIGHWRGGVWFTAELILHPDSLDFWIHRKYFSLLLWKPLELRSCERGTRFKIRISVKVSIYSQVGSCVLQIFTLITFDIISSVHSQCGLIRHK